MNNPHRPYNAFEQGRKAKDAGWPMDNIASPSPEEEVLAMEAMTGLAAAIDNIPAELRDIYELWHTGTYSLDELADQFDMSRGQIRARVNRLRKYLRENVDADTAMAVGLIHPTAMVEARR